MKTLFVCHALLMRGASQKKKWQNVETQNAIQMLPNTLFCVLILLLEIEENERVELYLLVCL